MLILSTPTPICRCGGQGVIILLFFLLLAFTCQATDSPDSSQIDINTAPLEDLIRIVHIGEARAKELISLRPFSSLDELTKIKGISESRVNDIKEEGLAYISPASSSEEKPQENIEVKLNQTFPSGIVINEILPSPEGQDSLEEWIEIRNLNNKEVDLSDWQIQDQVGSVTIYPIPEGTFIPPKGFLVFERPITKIVLNNTGDSLQLLQPNGQIIDELSYQKAPLGQSFSLTESGWVWGQTPTPGKANLVSRPLPTEGEKEEVKESQPQEQLAAVGEQVSRENPNSFLVLLIALAIAFFSGIIILTLKKQIKE